MTEASALECSAAPALFADSHLRFAKKEVLGCRWDVRDLAAHAVECKAGAPVIRILSSFESSSGRRRFSLMQCCATCFRERFGRGKKRALCNFVICSTLSFPDGLLLGETVKQQAEEAQKCQAATRDGHDESAYGLEGSKRNQEPTSAQITSLLHLRPPPPASSRKSVTAMRRKSLLAF